MAEVLELTQLSQPDGEAEVNIRRRGIDTEFDVKRAAKAELRDKGIAG